MRKNIKELRGNKLTNKAKTSPYLYAGYYCNNNCIFCSEADEYLDTLTEKSLEEIKKELKSIRKHYKFISIMGREPTIRPDFLEILRLAKKLKFKQVGFTTNGRLLSQPEFTKAVLKTGVDQIGISLSGATATTHDLQVQVPGAFNQTIAGIKNVVRYKNPSVSLLVNLPVNKLNYRELGASLKLVVNLGVKEINILNISPLSRRSNNKKIILPMAWAGNYVFNIIKNSGYFERNDLKILLVEFPPCSLPKEARKYFFPCLEKNNRKVRISLCSKCSYKTRCDGILDNYLTLYGEKNFKL
ncbi:MAG: radical SAM protein [Candidatus Parcubacteria bacterium]|nr:radical SAM protein [Candidatus Parcubacteria bacterium]